MLRYAITDRRMFPGGEQACRDALLSQVHHLTLGRADVIQMREKDLADPDLEDLARRAVLALHPRGRKFAETLDGISSQSVPKFLLNGPARVAASVQADGIHLPGKFSTADLDLARREFEVAGLSPPLLSTSCHTADEVRSAARAGCDYLLLGPVFEKRVHGELVTAGLGLDQLREAATLMRELCFHTPHTPKLLALGGITENNAELCLRAGADGIAGIRLFL